MIVDADAATGVYLIRFPPGTNVEALLIQLTPNPLVAHVELNYVTRLPPGEAVGSTELISPLPLGGRLMGPFPSPFWTVASTQAPARRASSQPAGMPLIPTAACPIRADMAPKWHSWLRVCCRPTDFPARARFCPWWPSGHSMKKAKPPILPSCKPSPMRQMPGPRSLT